MKILHICTQDNGGAGIATLRLHKGLLNLKIDSKMLILKSNSVSKELYSLFNDLTKFQRIIYTTKKRINNYLICQKNKKRPNHLEIFTYNNKGYDISNHKLVKEADIINLHWIENFVDYKKFFSKVKKPIVWTLHDMNPLTGGCHHSDECEKYSNHCNKCFQLNSKNKKDISYKIFEIKENLIHNLNIKIIAPSQWLLKCAEKSEIFKNKEKKCIPNGVPIENFRIINKENCREIIKLSKKKFVILFCAESINKYRKGSTFLIKALEHLKNEMDTSQITLLMIGKKKNNLDYNFDIKQLGYIQNEDFLSVGYNSADLFVIPSLAENLPNTIIESMSCGTPVVGFNVGGIPELIKDNKNGLLANYKDSKDLAKKIKWMIEHPEERKKMGINARKFIEEEFSQEIQAKEYIKEYEKLIEK